MHESAEPQGVSRRGVLRGAAWGVPLVAVAAATPLAAASEQDGGTLFLIGNAYENAGIYLSGTNYNGATSTIAYPINSLRITIFLPEIDGIEDTLLNTSPNWTAFRERNVVTLMNRNELAAGAESGDIGNVEITGPFPPGSPYTISVAPDTVAVEFRGNLQYTGTFTS
ncbi:hypothetical protein [Microbacterium sp. MYb45]|uniref:hypothetical protein n=1 Tax=Microbacterium sp. MYb45 TaxID=1827294 RepID=UPI000CFF8A4A|nr:hypothetical protein [Microbacterium sp. MYb45]PRB64072.1 hypothetical protein CQ034_07765 [Microbacterium sp. MYb45]